MAAYGAYTDQELTALLKQGDRMAFTELYNRYWKKLFTAAANKIDDLQEAEDIVQQIFISIWNRREVLVINSSLASYLAVSVKYRILKSLDKSFKEMHYGDEAATAALLEVPDDSTREWLDFQEVNEQLNMLVEKLPEKCRLVYKLSREQGYTQKQISEQLNISAKTVEGHITHAIKSLKTGLRNFFLTL
jgi:RNA polymerase sigma-70 factor (ECF subfamily)